MSVNSISSVSQFQQAQDVQPKSGGHGGRHARANMETDTTRSQIAVQESAPLARPSALKARYTPKGKSESESDSQSQDQAETEANPNQGSAKQAYRRVDITV